jgi:hypothetical protein
MSELLTVLRKLPKVYACHPYPKSIEEVNHGTSGRIKNFKEKSFKISTSKAKSQVGKCPPLPAPSNMS